jgi:carbon monoxide dehydrogenase subunit G
MEMTGEYPIAAPRQKVWEALNDAETLKACIPGCEILTKTSDTSFEAKVKARVGPVSATFVGAVTLGDLNPPVSYTISGEGKGGVAGFAKGGAKVALEELGPNETLLKYDVKAQVGGKLAQIGARLIDGTAKKLADEFFSTFAATVGRPAEEAPADHGQVDHDHHDHGHDDHGHHAPPPGLSDAELNKDVGRGTGIGVWVTAGIVVLLVLLAIFGLGGGSSGP